MSTDITIPDRFKNATDILGDGKILKIITKKGNGSAARATHGCTAKIHYTGTLLNGEKFDSSKDRNEHFETEVGKGQVIRGWDVTMPTMEKDECCEVLLHPDVAYGPNGSPPKIPPNSHLIFEMEMLGWYGLDISEDKNKSLTKMILEQDESADLEQNPRDGTMVTIEICEEQNDMKRVEYIIGEEELHDLIPAIGVCVKSMVLNEKSVFTLNRYTTYNKTKTDKEFTIKLTNFIVSKEVWDMSVSEAIEKTKIIKDRGTELFKQGHLSIALGKYKLAQSTLENVPFNSAGDGDKAENKEENDEVSGLKVATLGNITLIHLKLNEGNNAITAANKVLEIDATNEKALFRKGEGQLMIGELNDAIESYNKCLKVNAGNKAAKSAIVKAKKKRKAVLDEEKMKYSKMFK